MLFFISSKMFIKDAGAVTQTPLNEEIPGLNQSNIVIDKWTYNKKKSFMEVVLKVKNIGNDPVKPTYEFMAQLKTSKDHLPIELVYQKENLYVIHINKIDKDFTELGLIVRENRDETYIASLQSDSEEPQSVIVLKTNFHDVSINNQLRKRTDNEYLAESIDREIEGYKGKIKTLSEEDIPRQVELIKSLQEDIKDMEKQKKYQTATEIQSTNSDIIDKQNKINEYNEKQQGYMLDIEKVNEKIKKLEEKKADINS